jgi:alanyl-tRNA synthetase
MTTILEYERDPYVAQVEADVIAIGVDGERPYAVLSRTILYPEGGGQPADHGWLDQTAVTDVQRVGGEVRHYTDRAIHVGPVLVRLDWPRRFDHMQQHSGQHLLTAIAAERHGWPTTAFHLGVRVSDIELDIPGLSDAELRALEEEAVAEVRAARPVLTRRVSADTLGGLPVRTRGLPNDLEGDIRLVEIEGIDLNTCGGTHVTSTAEIETIKLLGTERMRGGTRLYYVTGGRVRARMAEHEARNIALRKLLGVAEDQFAIEVETRLNQICDYNRRERALEGDLAKAIAARLAGQPDEVVVAHLADRELAFLQQVGRQLHALDPGRVALVTGGEECDGVFVWVPGIAASWDVPTVGREIATILGGRGGGDATMFQGKATNLGRRDEVVIMLRSRLAGTQHSAPA